MRERVRESERVREHVWVREGVCVCVYVCMCVCECVFLEELGCGGALGSVSLTSAELACDGALPMLELRSVCMCVCMCAAHVRTAQCVFVCVSVCVSVCSWKNLVVVVRWALFHSLRQNLLAVCCACSNLLAVVAVCWSSSFECACATIASSY